MDAENNQTTVNENADTAPDTKAEVVDSNTSAPADNHQSVDAEAQDTEANASEQPEDGAEKPENKEPEWFMKDKYKSVEEQARAAFELQKKMGKFWGSPTENYNVEAIEGLQKDDPLLENLMPALKEIGLSQEGFSHLVKQYQEANIQMMKKLEDQLKEELTTKDAHTYQEINKWMNENLTPEEIKQIQNNWLMTPADFKMFNQLRLMAAPSTNVPNSSSTTQFESSKEVENDKIKYRKEVNQGLRVPDKNYENELARRFKDARSRELRAR